MNELKYQLNIDEIRLLEKLGGTQKFFLKGAQIQKDWKPLHYALQSSGPGLRYCRDQEQKVEKQNTGFYYSGNDVRNSRKGIGIVETKQMLKSVIKFVPYPDRTMIKSRAKPINLNIIQVCALTAESHDVTPVKSNNY